VLNFDSGTRDMTHRLSAVATARIAGPAVVRFSDRALGTACVQWSGTSGKYDPSKGYRVVHGSMKMIGGTGAASHWRGSSPSNRPA
jgi:hypothetical protein